MRGLTGERPEKDGRRSGEGVETGRRRVREFEEGKRHEGRADLKEDMLQTLVTESVGVAIAIGIAITGSVIRFSTEIGGVETRKDKIEEEDCVLSKTFSWASMGPNPIIFAFEIITFLGCVM